MINTILGIEAEELSLLQMGVRAIVVYIFALIMVRMVGDRRFIGKYAAFDVVLSIIFGSTVSRAINGSAAFWSTLFASFVLVAMHWLFSTLAFYSVLLESKIKGKPIVLVRDGQPSKTAMASCHITKEDLLSTLRLQLQVDDIDRVKKACLERNGEISFVLDD